MTTVTDSSHPVSKGIAWGDGYLLTRVAQADGTYAEGLASLLYVWDAGNSTYTKFTLAMLGAQSETLLIAGAPVTPTILPAANIAASQTDTVLLAAQAAKKIRVVSAYAVTGATATTLVFNTKGSGAGTAVSATFQNAANGGIVLPLNPAGWFETATGEALTVTTGAGSTTGIQATVAIY